MAENKKQHVVTAEAVVVFVNTEAERYLYKDAVIPEQVPAEEVKRLLDLGLVAEV
jgi:hypothetical protein